ncbi:MAG: hypothetical protein JF586_05375 [Burkholderiales bacterium]|nr:hypothetical protein [Burkholderiales bacterium]
MWTRREAGGARPRGVQRLVAVPWRHPALILACTLAGAAAAAALAPRQAAAPAGVAASAHGHVQPILPASGVLASATFPAGAGGPGLRLDLELGPVLTASPGEVVSRGDDARAADARDGDDIDALLAQSPPAAGSFAPPAWEGVAPAPAGRGAGLVPGLLAGLLLGLLAAAARELRGDRMRSVREAEWALGAPVLGAIPTLSARARGALLATAWRRAAAEVA